MDVVSPVFVTVYVKLSWLPALAEFAVGEATVRLKLRVGPNLETNTSCGPFNAAWNGAAVGKSVDVVSPVTNVSVSVSSVMPVPVSVPDPPNSVTNSLVLAVVPSVSRRATKASCEPLRVAPPGIGFEVGKFEEAVVPTTLAPCTLSTVIALPTSVPVPPRKLK